MARLHIDRFDQFIDLIYTAPLSGEYVMILRRIATAIKRQDWFQVSIEVLIVVDGIFLGLQVTDWNTGREERVLEIDYLSRLYQVIQSDIVEFDKLEHWFEIKKIWL